MVHLSLLGCEQLNLSSNASDAIALFVDIGTEGFFCDLKFVLKVKVDQKPSGIVFLAIKLTM
jgi:hypothetical protein